MSWNNVFARLGDGAELPCTSSPARRQFNPRPAGEVRPGSAADMALSVLLEAGSQFIACAQVVRLTGRTPKAVSWALIYLRSLDLIEAIADDGRNYRYQRYRITDEGIRYAASRPTPVARGISNRIHLLVDQPLCTLMSRDLPPPFVSRNPHELR